MDLDPKAIAQEALGVATGDLASVVFADNVVLNELTSYAIIEMADVTK